MRASSRRWLALVNVISNAIAWHSAVAILALFMTTASSTAEDLTALARLDPSASSVKDRGQGIEISLSISQPVPYRVSFLDAPPRMVVDFREVDFGLTPPSSINGSSHVDGLAWGPFLAGWSRLVVLLQGPQALVSAQELRAPDGGATITLRTLPTTDSAFAAAIVRDASRKGAFDWALPDAADVAGPIARQTGTRPLRVTLDPGHGGIDPGAEADGISEARLMLTFALELADVLRRRGLEVVLTRQDDTFLPLEARISVARAAGSDLFLSLHADALSEGEATGATVYTLDERASDSASAQLAERHDRADLLAGIDLKGQDDEVASVLMELARQETHPRAQRLAQNLTDAFLAAGIQMHRHPIQKAAFSVLKAADIPSVLLETGFLSSTKDRERLSDPAWRANLQQAILSALQSWSIADAAEARLLRQ